MLAHALIALLALPAGAQAPSPTLDVLKAEAQKDPALAPDAESARTQASEGFTGERAPVSAPAPVKKPAEGGGSYIMVGNSPIKGINIYTPKEDPTGRGSTEKPKAKELVSGKKLLLGAGAGAAGVIGGALLGGFFGGLLLVLGGALLGAAGVLWLLNRKTKSKD